MAISVELQLVLDRDETNVLELALVRGSMADDRSGISKLTPGDGESPPGGLWTVTLRPDELRMIRGDLASLARDIDAGPTPSPRVAACRDLARSLMADCDFLLALCPD